MWQDWISVDARVMHGRACVRGTRIPVSILLDNLAAGVSQEELAVEYPGLPREAVPAALAYAADLARERVVELAA
ncbi:MAG: DUF433 domain-containing protein [Panacagrimonas sp.]